MDNGKQVNHRWTHIYPLADVIEHDLEGKKVCQCNPYVVFGERLVIHEPLDGRKISYEEYPEGGRRIYITDGAKDETDKI